MIEPLNKSIYLLWSLHDTGEHAKQCLRMCFSLPELDEQVALLESSRPDVKYMVEVYEKTAEKLADK